MKKVELGHKDSSELNKLIEKTRASLYTFEKITNYEHSMVRKYDGEGGTYIEYRVCLTIEKK